MGPALTSGIKSQLEKNCSGPPSPWGESGQVWVAFGAMETEQQVNVGMKEGWAERTHHTRKSMSFLPSLSLVDLCP